MTFLAVHGNWSFCQPPSDKTCGICLDHIGSEGVNHLLPNQETCVNFFHPECLYKQLFPTLPGGQVRLSRYRIAQGIELATREKMRFAQCSACQNKSCITDTFLKSLNARHARLFLEENRTVDLCLSLLHYSVLLITAGAPIFGLASVIHRLSCSLLAKSALNIISAIFFGTIGICTAKAVSNLSLQYFLKDEDR